MLRTWHWIALIAVAFAIGLVWGKRWGERDAGWISEPAPAARAVEPQQLAGIEVPGFAEAVAARDWDALVELLEAANREGRHDDHARLYAGMRRVAADLVAAEAVPEAVDLLQRYAALNPNDHELRFLWADALASVGDYEGALQPVLDILESPLTIDEQERAAALRAELVDAQVEQITLSAFEEHQASDPESVAAAAADPLIELYAELVAREPLNDAHRLSLAEAYVAADRPAEALATLDEIAGYGVDTTLVEDLRAAIEARQETPDLRREERTLLANVQAAGRTLNLLLDTGATQTALSPDALARVGAQPLARLARVNTAGGPIEVPVYAVPEFVFGGQRFEVLEVIALADLPGSTDGLLGMDVLGQLEQVPLKP